MLRKKLHEETREEMSVIPEVDVEPAWKVGTHPNRWFPQLCFQKAFNYVTSHEIPGMELVHGIYLPPRAPMFIPDNIHAWVELPGDVVFDGNVQRFYERESYCAVMRAVPEARYDSVTAARLLVKRNHFGPWHNDTE